MLSVKTSRDVGMLPPIKQRMKKQLVEKLPEQGGVCHDILTTHGKTKDLYALLLYLYIKEGNRAFCLLLERELD